MSNLFSAEPEPEFQPESDSAHEVSSVSFTAHTASAEVELALRKFWDVVRSSAETIVTLRQEVAQLKAQKPAVVEVESEASRVRIDELEGALRDAQSMNELLEADVANSMRRVAELEAALEDGRSAQVQMRQEASESMLHLETELATANHHRSLLEQELAGMNLRVAELEARIDEKNEQLQESTETTVRAEILVREKEELEQRVERLNQRLSDLEGVIDDKTRRIETLVADLSSARLEVVEFELQISSRDAQIHELGELCDNLRHRVEELERERSEQAAILEAAQPPATDVEEQIDETDMQWQALREQLQAEAADLQEQLQRALTIIETYRSAGLRHLEDPGQRNQMTLFAAEIEPVQSSASSAEAHHGDPVAPTVQMTEQELTEIACRLDELASRVEELLGIS